MRCDLSFVCSVSSIASRFPLNPLATIAAADAASKKSRTYTKRVASPCRRMSGSTWNNSTCCRRNKGKARYISVLSAGAQSWRRTEQTGWKESTANIDETTTRPSSHCRRPHRHWRREEKGLDRGPIVGAVTQDSQPNWANTWHSQRGLFGLTCHSRLTVKPIPGTQERTRS